MTSLQAKVTTKGQITLPKAVREKLLIKTGDHVEFFVDHANKISIHRIQAAGSSAGYAKSFLKPNHKQLTRVEEKVAMAEAIAAKYAPKH